MKAGIVSYGAYIPIYRLSREEIARVWEGGYRRGEKAIANCDEDSITMGVEAGIDCIKGFDRNTIDCLYFASTTAPYREKRSASIIASALDLHREVQTADFANSLSAGANALKAALDAVNSGTARNALVIASDTRIPPPNSSFEPMFADGAAALLIGKDNIIASFEGQYSISSDFLDIWKRDRGDTYIKAWEDRFILDKGYSAHTREAITNLFKKLNITAKDITRAAYYGPDARSHGTVARTVGLESDQIQDPMFDVLGNTGCALFMMILVASLEKAKSGEKILTASYGDGADTFLLQITNQIESVKDKRGITKHLASKMMLPSYGKYLRFRNLMEWETTPTPPPESSDNVFYREDKALIRGYGYKCKHCGHVQFPPQRICMWCQTKDQFDQVRLVDKTGKIFTYSLDERAVFSLDLPNVLVIVDLEGGGRIYNQATDRDPSKLTVGMEMEFTFRKFHEGGGFINYSWKLRPVRC
jgi:hydroxymethylglutaryl-CoA synthase